VSGTLLLERAKRKHAGQVPFGRSCGTAQYCPVGYTLGYTDEGESVSETRTVGTGEGCDLRISDAPYMSTRHFALTRGDDGQIYVQDLGSMNGTDVYTVAGWVRAHSPIPVGPGSKIYAGRVLFKVDSAGQVSVQKDVSIFDRDRA